MSENFEILSGWVDVTPEGSGCPVYRVELTEEEDALREQSVLDATAFEELLANKETLKQSALAKLALLGLTEEEAKAVIGL